LSVIWRGGKELKTIAYFIGIVLLIGIIYSIWDIGRIINYKLSYKNMVRETIKEMVKKESLK